MRKQPFGEKQVSVIGLGTGDFGGACPEAQAQEFLDAYFEIGGNFIDTARVYGDFKTPKDGESEKVIGRWMAARHCRQDIFLATKCAHPPLSDMRASRLSRADIRADLAASLDALQTERVDICFLHRDDISRPVGDIMESLQSLLDDGWTGMTGVSNWRPERIEAANAYAAAHGLTPLSANQPQFSLAAQNVSPDPTLTVMDESLWHLHRKTGLTCCCFSSQAKGFFTKLNQLGVDHLPERLRRRFLNDENLAIYERMRAVRAQTGLSVGAIALAYLTCQPFPTFPLAGVSKVEQVLALRAAGDAIITPAQRDFLRTF